MVNVHEILYVAFWELGNYEEPPTFPVLGLFALLLVFPFVTYLYEQLCFLGWYFRISDED
jgi:hypothetical protein